MRRQFVVAGLIVVGLLLVVLGFQWSNLVPSSAYWSKEQGAEYTEAQANLHSKIDKHGDGQIYQRDLEAAKDRFVKIKTQLEQAQTSQSHTGAILKAVGFVAVFCGIAAHLARHNSGS